MENVFAAPVSLAEMPRHIPQSCVDPSTQMAWVDQAEDPTPVMVTNPTGTCGSYKSP
jgi:hypothetical protein